MSSSSSKKPCPLVVWIKGSPILRITPSLPRPATVGDVRSAVAQEMRIDPLLVTMERCIATDFDGNPCVQVCSRDDKLIPAHSDEVEFGTDGGAVRKKTDVFDQQLAVQYFDKDTFHLVEGRRSVVNVYRQSQRNIPVLLYIRNNGGSDFMISPLLQPSVTVGDIRKIVATEMKVKPEFVKLDRFVGKTPQGNRCVRVSDEDGRVVGFSSDAAMFADAEGKVYRKDRVKHPKPVALNHDDEPFVNVRGRRNIINLTQCHLKSFPLHVVVINEPNFDYNPLLPVNATVGDVRTAIATKLQVDPNCLNLEQWVAVTPTGEKCVQVCNEKDEFVGIMQSAEFGDVSGAVYVKNRVNEEHKQTLYNNRAPFRGVPGRRCIVNVDKKKKPHDILSLYISNTSGINFAMTIVVPRKVKVSEIQAAIGYELNVKAALVKIERWTGKSSFTLPCYQVCNKEGEFVNVRKDEVEFGDSDGDVYIKEKVNDRKLKELDDGEQFEIVPHRTSVINVTIT